MKVKVNRRTLTLLLSLLFLFPIISAHKLPGNLLYLNKYRFLSKIPEKYSKQIVIVSTRNFNQKQDSILKKGVHPNHKMFYFVISLQDDSVFITSFKNLDDALITFSKNRDFLIYVNGYGKNFAQNLYRGFEIDNRYNLNVIIFDWPADYQAIRKTSNAARKVTENLAVTLQEFDSTHKKYFSSTGASLIFHSMGNHIARNMVDKYPNIVSSQHIFDNVVLNAAGVTQFHHAKWVEKLKMQDRIFITTNKEDKTLKLLGLVRLSVQLGVHAKNPHASNAIYIDFSLIAGEEHNYFIGRSSVGKENPKVYNFFNEVFHSRQVNLNDTAVFRLKEKESSFFIF